MAVFSKGFDAAVHSNTSPDNSSKLTYLREAIKDSKVTHLLHRATSSETQYEDLVQLLIDRYDQKRLIHQNHSLALVNYALIKQGSNEELCMLMDTIEHNVSSMKDTKQYDLGTFRPQHCPTSSLRSCKSHGLVLVVSTKKCRM